LSLGIKKFILISVHDYNLPDFALQSGYFTGKRRAEERVLMQYPETGQYERLSLKFLDTTASGLVCSNSDELKNASLLCLGCLTFTLFLRSSTRASFAIVTGTILRPGFIYGSRRVNGIDVPLNFIGEPLEKLLAQTEVYTRPFAKLPASDVLFAPPVSVKDVALATLQAMRDDDIKGIIDIKKIKEIAASVSN
jgi:hypothetical protein